MLAKFGLTLGLAVWLCATSLEASILQEDATTFFSADAGRITHRQGGFMNYRNDNLPNDGDGLYVDILSRVERGAIRMRLDSKSGASFPNFSASVRDFYTLSGPATDIDAAKDGIQVRTSVTFTLEGTAREQFMPNPLNEVLGRMNATVQIGNDLSSTSHGVTDQSPYIQDFRGISSQGGRVLDFRDGEVDFTQSVTTDLIVTLDEEFRLAYGVTLVPTFGVYADMLNSATVSFDLADGLALL